MISLPSTSTTADQNHTIPAELPGPMGHSSPINEAQYSQEPITKRPLKTLDTMTGTDQDRDFLFLNAESSLIKDGELVDFGPIYDFASSYTPRAKAIVGEADKTYGKYTGTEPLISTFSTLSPGALKALSVEPDVFDLTSSVDTVKSHSVIPIGRPLIAINQEAFKDQGLLGLTKSELDANNYAQSIRALAEIDRHSADPDLDERELQILSIADALGIMQFVDPTGDKIPGTTYISMITEMAGHLERLEKTNEHRLFSSIPASDPYEKVALLNKAASSMGADFTKEYFGDYYNDTYQQGEFIGKLADHAGIDSLSQKSTVEVPEELGRLHGPFQPPTFFLNQ